MSSNDFRPNTSPDLEGRHPAVGDESARPTTDFNPAPPSDTVAPTQVNTPPQQAATQPGAGQVQHVIVQPAPEPSFNQKVVGYAKEIRGTILHNSGVKDHGGKIRKGEESWPPSQGEKGPSVTEMSK